MRTSDFEQGIDLTDVLENSADRKHGVVITLGHDSLTIDGVSRAELVSGDFIF